VLRTGTPDGTTLVVSGTINRFEEGNFYLRNAIGLGAGSAYFDAQVQFKDGSSSEVVAIQTVDKNSWVGGGAISAVQTPEEFMREAAIEFAGNLTFMKQPGKFPEWKKPNFGKPK
jgi:hypothetical protein